MGNGKPSCCLRVSCVHGALCPQTCPYHRWNKRGCASGVRSSSQCTSCAIAHDSDGNRGHSCFQPRGCIDCCRLWRCQADPIKGAILQLFPQQTAVRMRRWRDASRGFDPQSTTITAAHTDSKCEFSKQWTHLSGPLAVSTMGNIRVSMFFDLSNDSSSSFLPCSRVSTTGPFEHETVAHRMHRIRPVRGASGRLKRYCNKIYLDWDRSWQT